MCVCVSVYVSMGVCGGGARDDQRVGETFVDPGKRLRSCTLARLTDVEGRRVRGRWENGGGRGERGTNSNIERNEGKRKAETKGIERNARYASLLVQYGGSLCQLLAFLVVDCEASIPLAAPFAIDPAPPWHLN